MVTLLGASRAQSRPSDLVSAVPQRQGHSMDSLHARAKILDRQWDAINHSGWKLAVGWKLVAGRA